MKKAFFIGLLSIGLIAWGIVLWRSREFLLTSLGSPSSGSHEPATSGSDSDTLLARDPFHGPWTLEKVVAKPKTPHAVNPRNPVVAPPIDTPLVHPRFQGFVAGNPAMAILAQDGKTELVPVGSAAFGWTLLNASSDQIELQHGKHRVVVAP